MTQLEDLSAQVHEARVEVTRMADDEPIRAGLLGYAAVVEALTMMVIEMRSALTEEEQAIVDEAMGEVDQALKAVDRALTENGR